MRRMRLIFVAVSLSMICGASMAAAPATQPYLALLRQQLSEHSRPQIPKMTAAAEVAAKHFIGGHALWVAGSQPDFAPEACERAGGLVAIHGLANNSLAASGDVLLFGTRPPMSNADVASIRR